MDNCKQITRLVSEGLDRELSLAAGLYLLNAYLIFVPALAV